MMTLMLAQINGEAVISAVIWIICLGVVFWLLNWLIDYVSVPEPFAKIVRIILAVAAVILLINVILSIAGHPLIRW